MVRTYLTNDLVKMLLMDTGEASGSSSSEAMSAD